MKKKKAPQKQFVRPFAEVLAEIPDKILSQTITATSCDCPMCDCQNLVDGRGVICLSCRHGNHAN